MTNNIGKNFVQEFVIGLGLLGGLGVDPEGEILKALNQAIYTLNHAMDFTIWIIIFSIFVTIGSIVAAFAAGGWIGMAAVAIAFVGGYFISYSFAPWLIVIAFLLGLAAPNLKEKFQ